MKINTPSRHQDFKIGDKVQYEVSSGILFTGTVTEIFTDPRLKPYGIITDRGEQKYANPEYLKPINSKK